MVITESTITRELVYTDCLKQWIIVLRRKQNINEYKIMNRQS